jgi:hypothetical protein
VGLSRVITTPSKRIRPSVYGTFFIAMPAYTILKDLDIMVIHDAATFPGIAE